MKLYNILAVLITLSAGFSYINHRFIRLPTTIGLMAIALLVSLGLIALGPLGFGLKEDARLLLNSIDFDETLLHGMLSFLLFAGALHVNLADLARQKYIISARWQLWESSDLPLLSGLPAYGFWDGSASNCLSYTAFCSVP
jgi:CPA1 family monovalent cation:H+ antiporter